LRNLKAVGVAIETSIGKTFLAYIPYFQKGAAYICSFASASAEMRAIFKKNRPLKQAVKERLNEHFEGIKIKQLLLLTVGRIPQYSLLLRKLIEATPKRHWDYAMLSDACDLAHSYARASGNALKARLTST
jgi:hypothetical protein